MKNEPAFPQEWVEDRDAGLTKREYAAIHIMAGIAGYRDTVDFAKAAKDAVTQADALLSELDRTEGETG